MIAQDKISICCDTIEHRHRSCRASWGCPPL